jgi:pyridoxamine 5'-phosphate oxidase
MRPIMSGNLSTMRKNYTRDHLEEEHVDPDPFAQFRAWLDDASHAMSVIEANAMVLATVDDHGLPSARTVLLKGCDERGLVFYTNYESRKGRDIAINPAVALVFAWAPLERQVRIAGTAAKISPEESDAYFVTRPLGSQIGAIASPQSEPVPSRAWLEERFERFSRADGPIARPAHWGGYRVEPVMFEFWQGRPNRLHDRLRYDRTPHGWEIIRLAP